jgi:Queuosine salvage protein
MVRTQIPPRAFSRILATRRDPLDVLKTTAQVVTKMRHVRISRPRIESVARVLAVRPLPVPAWNHEYHFFDGSERTLIYLFLLDALNFCFWGEPRWTVEYQGKSLNGYWALAAALKRGVHTDARILDCGFLASVTPSYLLHVLRGRGEIPLIADRWRNAREVGRILAERFGGSAARLVEAAKGDAGRMARFIADNFSSFQDTTIYDSTPVCFFKRAQILVADISGSFGGKGWGKFRGLGDLTAFADYKLPQILRAWGILKYDAQLASRVNSRAELAKDSVEEIEIRAATLWSVEFLRRALAQRGRILTSLQIDWFLWESSQKAAKGIKPYHRVRTSYY